MADLIWGVDAHQIPITRDTRCIDYDVIATYDNALGGDAKKWPLVYCWLIDGKYVPVAYDARSKKLYACAEYKYFSGFKRWLDRFFPLAYLISGKE